MCKELIRRAALLCLSLALLASTAFAAVPLEAPPAGRSLVFLYNTGTADQADTLHTLQLLQPLMAGSILQAPGNDRTVIHHGRRAVTLPAATDLIGLNKVLKAAADQAENRRPLTDGERAAYLADLAQTLHTAVMALPEDRAADVWVVDRMCEYHLTWDAQNGRFLNASYYNRALTALLDVLAARPNVTLHLVYGDEMDRGAGDVPFSQGLARGMQSLGIAPERLQVHPLTEAGVQSAVAGALHLDWQQQTRPLERQAEGVRYAADFTPASGAFAALRITWTGDTAPELRLLNSRGEAVGFSMWPHGGWAWIIPEKRTAGETLTVSADREGMTMTPFIAAAKEAQTLTLTYVPDAQEEGKVFRGAGEFRAALDAPEVAQAAFTLTAVLTGPGEETEQLVFQPDERAQDDAAHHWVARTELTQVGSYTLSVSAEMGRAVQARHTVEVLNRAPAVHVPEDARLLIPMGVPGAQQAVWQYPLQDLFTDPEGDPLTWTLPMGEQYAAIADEWLTVTLPADKAEGDVMPVVVQAADCHGAAADLPMNLTVADFALHMADLRYLPETPPERDVQDHAAAQVTYRAQGEALAWYDQMRVNVPALPALQDALTVSCTGDGEIAWQEDGAFTLTLPAPDTQGERSYAFTVMYGGQMLPEGTIEGFTQTVYNAPPAFVPEEKALPSGGLVNDLTGLPLSLKEWIGFDPDLSRMFTDGDDQDRLSYTIRVASGADIVEVNGECRADGVYVISPGDASYPQADIRLTGAGNVTMTIEARDAEHSAQRTLALRAVSLLMVICIAAAAAALLVITVLAVRHVTRPTFRGRMATLEQNGARNSVKMDQSLWLDGMTLAQLAVMAADHPGDELTLAVMGDIRIKPVKNGFRVLAAKGCGAAVDPDGRTVYDGHGCTIARGREKLTVIIEKSQMNN